MDCEGGSCRDVGANFDTLHLTDFCMIHYDPVHFPCIEQAQASIFPLQLSMIFLIADTLLLLVLLWWLSHVWQGQYGAAQPLCFCLTRSIRAKTAVICDSEQPALSIQHLRKVYDGKAVVDDLSLDIQKLNEIDYNLTSYWLLHIHIHYIYVYHMPY